MHFGVIKADRQLSLGVRMRVLISITHLASGFFQAVCPSPKLSPRVPRASGPSVPPILERGVSSVLRVGSAHLCTRTSDKLY